MRVNDAVSATILILLALVMIGLTASFPPFPGQKYGPSLFPRILGAGIILFSLILLVRGVAARRAGAALVTFAPWTRDPWRMVSFLLVLGLVALYILAAEAIGFIPVAAAILLVLFLWFRVRPLTAILVAVGATLAIHWFFASLMRVPLPRGLFMSLF